MAITPTNYGAANNKTAATTIVVSTFSLIPANTLLVLAVTADNTSATAPTITGITAVGGGTWTNQAGSVSQSGATATAGAGVFVYCYTLFTTTSVASGTNITVTFNASPTAKAVVLEGFTEMSGTLRNTVASAASTSGVPSVATTGTALVAGDLVIGIIGQENSVFSTVDTDTLNGTWAIATGSSVATSGGQAATNASVQIQYKVVTATGAQTFNPPGGANDSVAIVFAMQPPSPVAPAARTISAVAGTPAQSAVNLTWADDTAAAPDPTYLIESSPNGTTGWTTVATGQTGQTGYNATGLTPGTTYYFRVTGSNSAGSSTSNVAGPITTTTYPKLATFTDTFATQIDPAKWASISAGSVWDASGRAKLPIDAVFNSIQTSQTSLYDLTSSGLFVQMTVPTLLASSQALVEIRPPAGGTDNRLFFRVFGTAPTTIEAFRVDNGTYSAVGSTTYSPTNHAWVRVTEAGGTLTYATSPDGTTWNTLGTIAKPTTWNIASVYVMFSVGDASASPGNAFYDNVNVAPAGTTGQPKVYLAGAFTKKPLKVFVGGSWVTKPVKVWTGSTWKTLT